jgi:hypothetical protein
MMVLMHAPHGLHLRSVDAPCARRAPIICCSPVFVLAWLWIVAACFACTTRESTTSDARVSASGSSLASGTVAVRVLPAVTADVAASARAAQPLASVSALTSAMPNRPDASRALCGVKGGPACPLQAYMQTEMVAADARADFQALAEQFDRLAAGAPARFEHWVSIARDGAAASRRGESASVRAACRGCHEQYVAGYIAEYRSRPW